MIALPVCPSRFKLCACPAIVHSSSGWSRGNFRAFIPPSDRGSSASDQGLRAGGTRGTLYLGPVRSGAREGESTQAKIFCNQAQINGRFADQQRWYCNQFPLWNLDKYEIKILNKNLPKLLAGLFVFVVIFGLQQFVINTSYTSANVERNLCIAYRR